MSLDSTPKSGRLAISTNWADDTQVQRGAVMADTQVQRGAVMATRPLNHRTDQRCLRTWLSLFLSPSLSQT